MTLALTLAVLTFAGVALLWRAEAPSDGTTINLGDVAASWNGVTLQGVEPGIPLLPGDEVLSIGGQQLGAGGIAARIGEPLRYEIRRDGVTSLVEVTPRSFLTLDNLASSWPSILVCLVLLATALAVFAVRPRDPATQAALLVSALGTAAVTASGFFDLEALDLVAGGQFWRWYGGELCFALLWGAMLHFALAFPAVTKPEKFRRQLVLAYGGPLLAYGLLCAFAALALEPWPRFVLLASPALGALYLFPPLVLGVLAVKYFGSADPVTRRRLRWLAMSLGGGAALYLGVWIIPTALTGEPPMPVRYATLAFLPVPLALVLAVVRHRALNIEVVLSRSLVYGTLTVGLAGLYVGVVSLLSLVFPPLDQLWQQAAAATAIALAVHPLRGRLQSMINRRLFGEASDPYRVVSGLASRLETVRSPEDQLPAVVETIGTALRLPYVAIELDRDSGPEKAASFGTPTELSHRLPLTYRGEPVGQLVIARRGPREVLGRKELEVLTEVARHAGTVVHTARLTTDLVRLRDRLVHAREEERRRLLRDLHDGVGPTLAAISLGLHAGRRALGESAPVAPLLARLQDALGGATAEIRRLARDLRPPALDRLGLLGAIADQVDAVNCANGPRVVLNAPEELPGLPPAVDVAAYRIVGEALANVTRHAEAATCVITLRAGRALEITVADDGVGIGRDHEGTGVGLRSMRERAAELGGDFSVDRQAKGGTLVSARLPLPVGTVETG